jgi:hypothetical protein
VAGVVERIRAAAKKSPITRDRVGRVGTLRQVEIGRIAVRVTRRADVVGIEQENVAGRIDLGAVVPDVRDDAGAVLGGKIDPDGTGRGIGGVQADLETEIGLLPGRRVRSLARGHGHDLHAHDHEAVVEDAAHDQQEERQDDRKFNESLALALAPGGTQRCDVGFWLHCSIMLLDSST